jgi:hypothetical protein
LPATSPEGHKPTSIPDQVWPVAADQPERRPRTLALFVQSIVLAGAGIPGSSVYGASNSIGALPAEKSVTPPDLIATFLHLLGVRPDLELHDRSGRPLRACEGKPISALLA